jgi:flagellar motor protein MotB
MNRVQRGRGPAVHTDDWLITYADMITLLLCFFVIFFVILYSRRTAQERPAPVHVLRMVQVVQQTPLLKTLTLAAKPKPKASALPDFDAPDISLADEAAAKIGRQLHTESIIKPDAGSALALTELRTRLITDASLSPARSGYLSKSETPIGTKSNGDSINAFEISSWVLFSNGSADLSETGRSILRNVAVELKSVQYEGYDIVVEGHTDDTPITTTRFPSNWELSTARAAAVVHFFLDQGLAARRLRAEGYADTRPKVPNRDASGNAIPENQAQNRRVVIRLEKIDKSE